MMTLQCRSLVFLQKIGVNELVSQNTDDKLIKLVQSSTHRLMGSFRDKTELLKVFR